jgi:hypothetical protein
MWAMRVGERKNQYPLIRRRMSTMMQDTPIRRHRRQNVLRLGMGGACGKVVLDWVTEEILSTPNKGNCSLRNTGPQPRRPDRGGDLPDIVYYRSKMPDARRFSLAKLHHATANVA